MTNALTVSTALKQLIEASGLGVMGYRDHAPEDAEMPFVVITEAIASVPQRSGDASTDDATEESVQIDLWEQWIDRSGANPSLSEVPSRANALVAALHGSSLDSSPTKAYGIRVDNRTRRLDREANTVRNIIDVTVHRNLK